MSYKEPGKPALALPWTQEALGKRLKKAKDRKDNWITLYREAQQYITPQREAFYEHAKGEKKGRLVYDTTAQEAADIFASRIMSTITPSWQRWSEFRAGSDIPEDNQDEINKALTQSNKILFDFINHSNFTSQATETYLDLCFGTGAMLVERGDGDDLLVFTNIPLNELILEEGPNSTIQNNFRLKKAPARILAQVFPNAEWSDSVLEAIKQGDDSPVTVVMASLYDSKSRKYFQIVFEENGLKLNQYHTEDTNPFIIPRWAVTPQEIYGRGPAIKMLASIKTLNKMTEFTLRHASMAVSGAYTAVSDGVVNPYNLKIRPNAIIPVKQPDSLQPLPPAGQPEFNQLLRSELRQEIKDAFLASPMPSFNDPVRTATEISIRNSEMLKNSGAQLGRLKSEWVEPIIARCVDILKSEGKLPEIKVDGREVTIKHTSPLAQIEDQEDLQGLRTYFEFMAQAEVYSPGITALKTKLEDMPDYLAVKIGGFEELIRSRDEAEEVGETVLATGEALAEEAGAEIE